MLTGNRHDIWKREEDDGEDEPGNCDRVDRHTDRVAHEEWAAVHGPAPQQDIGSDRHDVRDVVDGDGRTQHSVEGRARAEINTAEQSNDRGHGELGIERDPEFRVDFCPSVLRRPRKN